MTKITVVRSCTVRIPPDQATSFSTRRVLGREFALVEIEADDGHKGIGFTYGGSVGDSIVRTLLARKMPGEGLKAWLPVICANTIAAAAIRSHLILLSNLAPRLEYHAI